MKKNVFLWVAVFAVGAMSSCSVDKVVDQAEARYIGFDAFANKVTRTKPADFPHENFGVWGAYNSAASVVFTNKEVTYQSSDGSWSYGTPEPWVSGQEYEFAAIAPYVNGASYDYGTDKYTLGKIIVDATEEKQIDYMKATPQPTVQSGTNSVSFVFNHILSKIDFIFQPKTTSNDNTHWQSPVRIEITKIELADVPTTNTYANDAWGELDTSGTNKATFTEGEGTSALVETSYPGSGGVTQSDNTFDWLVVPQGTTAGSITRTLTITCDVYDEVTGGTQLISGATASVNITTNWAENTYYTYTVSIGADILGENPYITFDVASVTDWPTKTPVDLNVPTN